MKQITARYLYCKTKPSGTNYLILAVNLRDGIHKDIYCRRSVLLFHSSQNENRLGMVQLLLNTHIIHVFGIC